MKKKENVPVTERTRIITAKITIIDTVKPGEAALTRDEKKKQMAAQIKKALKADDVNVSNVQDFLLSK